MKPRVFGLAAILGAVGAGFCCLAPAIFSVLGVSTVISLTTLRFVAPYRNVFFGVTLLALALAIWSLVVRCGRASRTEWAVLGGAVLVVVAVVAYSISVEGLPIPW
jgi:hypothetical protein